MTVADLKHTVVWGDDYSSQLAAEVLRLRRRVRSLKKDLREAEAMVERRVLETYILHG